MPDGGRELRSWKEIAAYLGVNVRTAQKWEQERNLPVRRLPGRRGRVAADTAGLDTWKQTPQTTSPAREAPESSCYRWPLGPHVAVEVRFVGAPVSATHIELLRQYLELAKAALDKAAQGI